MAQDSKVRTFGIFAGFSFPKYLVLKSQLNITDVVSIDYQAGLGYFWMIHQGDLLFFLSRGRWNPYIGAGYQYWKLYAFTTNTTYNNVPIGEGSDAVAVSAPLGIQFINSLGFAFDISAGGGLFVRAPKELQNRAVLELQASLGFFF